MGFEIIPDATVRIKHNSIIARVAAFVLRSSSCALVIRNTIYLYGIRQEAFLQNTAWLRHELTHVIQYQREGMLFFLLKYVYFSITKGYTNNPYEIEARGAEKQMLDISHTQLTAKILSIS